MIHYFLAGGIFMWGILLASICGLAVILEKTYLFLTSEKNLTENYKKELYRTLKKGSKKDILELCREKKDSVSQLVVKTIENSDIDFDKADISHKQYMEEIITENILEQTMKQWL